MPKNELVALPLAGNAGFEGAAAVFVNALQWHRAGMGTCVRAQTASETCLVKMCAKQPRTDESAESMSRPQPAHVGLEHVEQTVWKHIEMMRGVKSLKICL